MSSFRKKIWLHWVQRSIITQCYQTFPHPKYHSVLLRMSTTSPQLDRPFSALFAIFSWKTVSSSLLQTHVKVVMLRRGFPSVDEELPTHAARCHDRSLIGGQPVAWESESKVISSDPCERVQVCLLRWHEAITELLQSLSTDWSNWSEKVPIKRGGRSQPFWLPGV